MRSITLIRNMNIFQMGFILNEAHLKNVHVAMYWISIYTNKVCLN